MVQKPKADLDFSKTSCPDCIPNCMTVNKAELSHTLVQNLCCLKLCLKESFFPDCLKVSYVVNEFKNIREKSQTKNYRP